MALMQESEQSLKTFFLVVGGFSLFSHVSNMSGASGLVSILLVLGIAVSVAFLVIGLRFQTMLRRQAKLIELAIYADLVQVITFTAWIAWIGLGSLWLWVVSGINVAIAVYLLKSTRRLASRVA